MMVGYTPSEIELIIEAGATVVLSMAKAIFAKGS
jgi:hypothetical protein